MFAGPEVGVYIVFVLSCLKPITLFTMNDTHVQLPGVCYRNPFVQVVLVKSEKQQHFNSLTYIINVVHIQHDS